MRRWIYCLCALIWGYLIFHLTTTSQIVVTTNSWLQDELMNLAHFGFFGIEALLLMGAFNFSYSHLISILLTSIYGAYIEFYQLHVPGRTADPKDWLLDTVGALLFVIVMRKYSHKL